jgi:hypothetical protein
MIVTDHVFKAIEPFGERCRYYGLNRGEHVHRPDAFEEADELDKEDRANGKRTLPNLQPRAT